MAAGPRRRYARDAACACGCGMIHSCSVTGGTRPERWAGPKAGGGNPVAWRRKAGFAARRARCRVACACGLCAADSGCRPPGCRLKPLARVPGRRDRSEQEMARRQAAGRRQANARHSLSGNIRGVKPACAGGCVRFVGPLAQDAMARTYCRIIRRIGNVAGVALGAASPAVRATAHGVVRGDQSAAEMTPVQASAGLTHQTKSPHRRALVSGLRAARARRNGPEELSHDQSQAQACSCRTSPQA